MDEEAFGEEELKYHDRFNWPPKLVRFYLLGFTSCELWEERRNTGKPHKRGIELGKKIRKMINYNGIRGLRMRAELGSLISEYVLFEEVDESSCWASEKRYG